jgi:hypothetical protein
MSARIAMVAAAVWVAACGAEEADPRPGAGPASAVVAGPTSLPQQTEPEGPRLELLDPGSEPRRALRYRPRTGSPTLLIYGVDLDYRLEVEGNLMMGERGSERIEIELAFDRVEGDLLHYRLTFGAREQLSHGETQADELDITGEQGTLVVSSRGQLIESDVPVFKEHPALLEEIQMTDLFFLLPEEPVGAGARWRVERTALRNGITVHDREEHRLTTLDERGGRTEHWLDQVAPGQVLDGIDFAPDPVSLAEVREFSSTGTGETRFDLERPVPDAAEVAFSFTTEMRFRHPDGARSVHMKMAAKVQIESRPGRAARP